MTTPENTPDDPRLVPLDGPDAAEVEEVELPPQELTVPGPPTQTVHPWRAALRTVAAYVVVLVPALAVALPLIAEELGPYLPDAWAAWLIGAAAFLTTLAGLVTRIMALERIQHALEAIGLGTGVHAEHGRRARR